MQFIHFIFLPLLILAFSIFLQKWLNREEFIQFYKLYFIGIIAGFIILLILKFINPFFYGTAKYYTVLIKTLTANGILFSIFIIIVLFLFFQFNQNIKYTNSWSLTSILSFSYISGIYTVIDIQECLTDNYPDYLTYYLIFIPLILFISLVSGFGVYRFFYDFKIYKKILWLILIIPVIISAFTGYYFVMFYNFYYKYIFLLLFGGLYIIFEFADFKLFRS